MKNDIEAGRHDAGERERPGDEAHPSVPGGAGRLVVDLVSCVERSMHSAAHSYPAVDHVLPHPPPPGDQDLDALDARLTVWGSRDLKEAFEHWRAVHRGFVLAIGRLDELHGHGAEQEQPSVAYQLTLSERIHAVREARVALGRATDLLRDRVAADVDAMVGGGGR